MKTLTLLDCVLAFAVPGENSIIDAINPVTGKSWIEGEDLEQIRKRYPKAEIINLEEFCAAKAARQDTPIIWDEIKEDQYSYWLECLPPAAWIGGAFMVGEASDHHAGSGAPRYQACKEEHGKFFASSRPMTRKEFHEMFATKTTRSDRV